MPRPILSTRTTPMNSAWSARSARLIIMTFAAKGDWAPARIAITTTTTLASAVRTMHFTSGNKTHCWTMRPGNRDARDHPSPGGSFRPGFTASAATLLSSAIARSAAAGSARMRSASRSCRPRSNRGLNLQRRRRQPERQSLAISDSRPVRLNSDDTVMRASLGDSNACQAWSCGAVGQALGTQPSGTHLADAAAPTESRCAD